MAEVVGTAYVRIRALTAGLGKDIKDGLDSGMGGADFDIPQNFKDNINKGMEEAGEEGADHYAKGHKDRTKRDSDKNSKSILKSWSQALKKNAIPGKVWAIALGIPALGAVIKLASSYLLTLVGQLGYIVTAAAGAGAALGGIFAAAGLAALPLVLAFKAETEALDVFNESIAATGQAWLEVGVAAQIGLLPALDRAFETTTRLIPLFSEFAGQIGEIAGKAAEGAAGLITSGRNLELWSGILDGAAAVFQNLMDTITPLVGAMVPILAAIMPLAVRMSESMQLAAENFYAFIQAGSESGSLTATLSEWYDRAESIGRSIWNLIQILWELFTVGADTVSPMFETLEATTDRWLGKIRSEAGQAKLEEMFETALPVAQEFNRLVGAIIEMIGEKIMAPGGTEGIIGFMQALRTEFLPAIGAVADALGENLASGLGDLVLAFMDLVTVLAESGALGTFTRILGGFIEQLVELMKIPGVADVVAKLAVAFATWSAIKFVAKPFVGAAESIGGFVKGVEKFANSNFLKILKSGGISGLLRTLGTSIATFGTMLWGAISPLLPVIAIIAAIIAVAYGIYWAIKNWDKILPVLKNVWNAISTFFVDLWTTISDFFEGIGDWIAEAWTSFIDFFQELPSKVGTALADFFTGIGTAISEWVASLPGMLLGAATALWQWIVDAVPQMLSALLDFGIQLFAFIIMLPLNIGTMLVQGAIALWKWIQDAIPQAVIWLANLWLSINTWIATTISNLIARGVELLTSFIKWVVDAPGKVLEWLATTWVTINTWIATTISSLIAKGVEMLKAFVQWIVDAATQAPGKLAEFAESVWTWITEFVKGLPQKFIDAITSFVSFGSALFQAVKDGLTSALGSFGDWAGSLLGKIREALINAAPEWLKGPLRSLFGGGNPQAPTAGSQGGPPQGTAGLLSAGIRAGGPNLGGAMAFAGGGVSMSPTAFGMTGLMTAAVPSTVAQNQFTTGGVAGVAPINLVVQIGETDITDLVDARISDNDRATAQSLWVQRR